jgi:hypothetical protein
MIPHYMRKISRKETNNHTNSRISHIITQINKCK